MLANLTYSRKGTMTKQAIGAGDLLDVDVLDHIILAHGRFESLKTRKVAFQ